MRFGWFGAGSGALGDAAGVGDVAASAESLGYESVWVGEHPVLIDPQAPPSPLRPDTDMLDPVAALCFAAARTERLLLGTGIIILPLRNPLILAKQVASLDILSGGRAILGVGVGYVPGEYEAIGVDFHTRGRRTDDHIDAMRSIWCDEHPRTDGSLFAFGGVQSAPRPRAGAGVPIHTSGTSSGALRRAVRRANGWYGFFLDLDRTAAALRELRDIAASAERPSSLGELEITITPPPGPLTADDAARYEELGVARLVLMQDFADMAGQASAPRRDRVLAGLESAARDLGIGR